MTQTPKAWHTIIFIVKGMEKTTIFKMGDKQNLAWILFP